MSFLPELRGDLIADLGTLPSERQDVEVSLAIRRHAGKPPHLEVKLVVRTMSGIETQSFQIACSPERADYLEKVAREMRRQIDAPAP